MRISILDDTLNTIHRLFCYEKLSGHQVTIWNEHAKDESVLADRLRDTEILVTIRERTPISGALLRRLPHLRLISCRGDVPHIDLDTCNKLGIVVCADQHPDVPSYVTAELAWGLIISTLRRIPQQMAQLKAGRWQTEIGIGLRGRTLGIFGYGKIGKVLARYGRAFEMRVVVWGRESSRAQAIADGYEAALSKESFFAECDVISLQMRLRDSTQGIVDTEDLERMKPTALLVNTSRAGLIAPGALVKALRNGRPGFAAVDVYETEPMVDVNDPLLQLDNVICTPHIGFVEFNSFNNSFSSIFDQINAFASGSPINVINKESLEQAKTRWS
jgi:D-3-phosphoglycerate dehydrogenase